jgi:uncharacterized protein (TIGR03382 family)
MIAWLPLERLPTWLLGVVLLLLGGIGIFGSAEDFTAQLESGGTAVAGLALLVIGIRRRRRKAKEEK